MLPDFDLNFCKKSYIQVTPNDKRLLAKTPKAFYIVVPRDRIELPTRGFSVPCSTD